MRELALPAVKAEIANALDFISNSLDEFNVKEKKMVQDAMIATEETLVQMIAHAKEESEMEISVKKNLFGNVVIRLAVPGEEFELDHDTKWAAPITMALADEPDENALDKIRESILTSLDGEVEYEYKKGLNTAQVVLKKFD